MLKINKLCAHEYVCCLPNQISCEVMGEVKKAVSALHLTETEKIEACENAECEKLCNLTDTIEIQFI